MKEKARERECFGERVKVKERRERPKNIKIKQGGPHRLTN